MVNIEIHGFKKESATERYHEVLEKLSHSSCLKVVEICVTINLDGCSRRGKARSFFRVFSSEKDKIDDFIIARLIELEVDEVEHVKLVSCHKRKA